MPLCWRTSHSSDRQSRTTESWKSWAAGVTLGIYGHVIGDSHQGSGRKSSFDSVPNCSQLETRDRYNSVTYMRYRLSPIPSSSTATAKFGFRSASISNSRRRSSENWELHIEECHHQMSRPALDFFCPAAARSRAQLRTMAYIQSGRQSNKLCLRFGVIVIRLHALRHEQAGHSTWGEV